MPNVQKHILAKQDYITGMTYRDIANKYGVSINTVKSWKQRHSWVRDKGAHKNKKGCAQNKEKYAEKKEVIAEAVESVIKNPDLNDEQRLFCLQYVKRFNATKAYQKAYHCSYETAMVNGCKLLRNPKVKAEIDKLKQGRFNRAMLQPEDIFQKYMDIAFADITDYLEFGTEEVPVMSMHGPITTVDEDTGEKIPVTKKTNVVRFKRSDEVDGTLIAEVKQGKDGASLKLPDQMKALDWLANHMDLATEEQRAKVEQIKTHTAKLKVDIDNNSW